MIDTKVLNWKSLVERMAVNPAVILGLKKGSLSAGADADIVIIDKDRPWFVTKENLESKSKNTPFLGRTLKGMAVVTITGGKIAYRAGENG